MKGARRVEAFIPDANHKVVIVDPLEQSWSVQRPEDENREERNTVATATTARAISVVSRTRRPSCSRIPMRILKRGFADESMPCHWPRMPCRTAILFPAGRLGSSARRGALEDSMKGCGRLSGSFVMPWGGVTHARCALVSLCCSVEVRSTRTNLVVVHAPSINLIPTNDGQKGQVRVVIRVSVRV